MKLAGTVLLSSEEVGVQAKKLKREVCPIPRQASLAALIH
jgi:hypothetical protein